MLIKRNNLTAKINRDNARKQKTSLEDLQNALMEIAEIIDTQDSALMELATLIDGEGVQ